MARSPKKQAKVKAKAKVRAKAKKLTWQDVFHTLQFLQICVSKNGSDKNLPFGKVESDEINAECDAWFYRCFTSKRRDALSASPELAPWIMARLIVASGLVQGYMRFKQPLPDGAKHYALVHDMLVTEWNERTHQLWPGFHYADGRVQFDLMRSGAMGFSPN